MKRSKLNKAIKKSFKRIGKQSFDIFLKVQNGMRHLFSDQRYDNILVDNLDISDRSISLLKYEKIYTLFQLVG